MKTKLAALTIVFATTLLLRGESRQWTSSDGRKIEATILGLDTSSSTVKLRTERGVFELPLSRLSEADQTYAKKWAEDQEKKSMTDEEDTSGRNVAPTLGNFDNIQLGTWPQYVTADLSLDQIETIESGDGESGQYIYRTPHFEFHSPERLSASVIREFARIFEATYAFVDQMPIGLAPKPSANGFYQTKLYMTRDAYYADGGMQGSGGMFSWQRRGNEMSGMIKVPLPNLGVEYTGTRFIVDHKKRSTTLTHEITHQVMMRWLATAMPTWLSEGIAEVVSSQDYNNGRFKLSNMNRAIVDEVNRRGGRDFTMVPLEKLMNITSSQWSMELASGSGGQNYNSASVLAYYFLCLDGEGDAAHLVEFLKDLPNSNRGEGAKTAMEEHLLRGKTYAELQDEVAKAWRSEGLRIEF